MPVTVHVGQEIFEAEKLEEGLYRAVETGSEYRITESQAFKDGELLFEFEPEVLRLESEDGQVVDHMPCVIMPGLPEEVATQGLESGYTFWGVAGEVVYNACIREDNFGSFWKPTRVPFSLEEGEGKRIRCFYAEGPGGARASLGGFATSMDPRYKGTAWEVAAWAHEIGHINWLRHCCEGPDLMTNPVGARHRTTPDDRMRFRRQYTSHGGRLLPAA